MVLGETISSLFLLLLYLESDYYNRTCLKEVLWGLNELNVCLENALVYSNCYMYCYCFFTIIKKGETFTWLSYFKKLIQIDWIL